MTRAVTVLTAFMVAAACGDDSRSEEIEPDSGRFDAQPATTPRIAAIDDVDLERGRFQRLASGPGDQILFVGSHHTSDFSREEAWVGAIDPALGTISAQAILSGERATYLRGVAAGADGGGLAAGSLMLVEG